MSATARRGWAGHRWLVLRRLSQAGILLLFLAGPWLGAWIVKGNLNFSLTLGVLPLADPLLIAQTLVTRHLPETLALAGVAIVIAFYLLVGGRSYCAWVCPINPVADLAHWLRARLGFKGGAHVSRSTRYWLLAMTLAVSALTGTIAWEMFNPVSMLHRGLIFGFGMAWTVVLAVFLFDLFVMNHGWCGHLCPQGAAYGLIGRASLLRVRLPARTACDDCMDCFAVCPEPQVIRPALKAVDGAPPVILDADCTNCGRCIDVCAKDVFRFGTRVAKSDPASPGISQTQPL